MRALSLAGFLKSKEKALFHYMFAADRHNNEAQLKSALLIEGGNGANGNLDRAIMYFKLSARGAEYLELGHGVKHPRKLNVKV